MRHTILILGLATAACSHDDKRDKDDGPSTGGSAWLVGDDGEMLRMAASGEVEPYPLDSDADLRAIACVGEAIAWVVGSEGTVLSTDDGGRTWAGHDLGLDVDLAAVAAVGGDAGTSAVVVAGDGVVRMSGHGGAFVELPAPPRRWTAAALDVEHGLRILLAADDGSLWRSDGVHPAAQVLALGDRSLAGVAFVPGGEQAVAVGSGGTVAVSSDGGGTWTEIASTTERDLFAVRISDDGDRIVAVGQAGVVVTIDEFGARAHEQLDPALALRGLHVDDDGHGQAVGDAGVVLVTADGGRTWIPRDVGSDVVLRAVDDVD